MVKLVTQADVEDASKAVRTVTEGNKKLQASYLETTKRLAGAIQDRNQSMVELYRPQLEKLSKQIANCIDDVEGAIALVEGLKEDEAFLAKRFDLVEKLLGGVSKLRTVLTKQLVDCKKLDQVALKALDSLQGDAEDATSEYAHLERIANDVEARLDKLRPVIKKHMEAAKTAVANSDQPALTQARVALLDLKLNDLKIKVTVNIPKLQAFRKKYPDSELKTEATWLNDKLEKLKDDLEEFDKKITDLVKLGQIAAKGAGGDDSKPDVAKAAKLLGIKGADQPKLAKVLNGKPSTYEKGLAALAEDLDLEERNGKKLVAKLEKAKVLVG